MFRDGEIFINYNSITAVTADSHSIADTVDTDCLTVATVNRCYCRQINWQLLAERQSECQNVIGSLVQVENRICTVQELTPQTLQFRRNFIGISKHYFA